MLSVASLRFGKFLPVIQLPREDPAAGVPRISFHLPSTKRMECSMKHAPFRCRAPPPAGGVHNDNVRPGYPANASPIRLRNHPNRSKREIPIDHHRCPAGSCLGGFPTPDGIRKPSPSLPFPGQNGIPKSGHLFRCATNGELVPTAVVPGQLAASRLQTYRKVWRGSSSDVCREVVSGNWHRRAKRRGAMAASASRTERRHPAVRSPRPTIVPRELR
jgi:hypothetical protein